MGLASTIFQDIWNAIEDVVTFFVVSFLLVFILGVIWGIHFQGTEFLWWPIYLLFVIMLIKAGKDMTKKKK